MSYGCHLCKNCKHYRPAKPHHSGCTKPWPAETPISCSQYHDATLTDLGVKYVQGQAEATHGKEAAND